MKIKKISFLFLLLVITFTSFAEKYKYEEKNGIRSFHQGNLIVKEGIPFLTVKGDSYEMGLQYGVLLNDHILKMDEKIDSIVSNYIGKFFLKKWLANMVIKSKIRKIEKKVPQEFIDELEGIAKGCDLNRREVKMLAYFPQLFFDISCTSFVLKNENGIVHGRNLDWPNIETFTHFPLIVNYHRKGKIPTTILTFINYPGAYTGMNHNGLSMSINLNGCPVPEGKKESDYHIDMPMPFKLRQVMENADELKEVDELFKNYSTHAWFITVGSDKDKSSAIYELTRGEVIKNKMHGNYLGVTNLSLSDKGRYEYSPITMHNESNIARECNLKELNQNLKNDNLVDKAHRMLSSTSFYDMNYNPDYTCSVNNSMTVISSILDNTNRKIYFSYEEKLAGFGKFISYDLKSNEVDVYKQKQTIPNEEHLKARKEFDNWFDKNYGKKKKLEEQDYRELIDYVKKCKMVKPEIDDFLAAYYTHLKDSTNAYLYAKKALSATPKNMTAYQKMRFVQWKFKDYKGAIETVNNMLKKIKCSVGSIYNAKKDLVIFYNSMNKKEPSDKNVQMIHQLTKEINEMASKYQQASWVKKRLKWVNDIDAKFQ